MGNILDFESAHKEAKRTEAVERVMGQMLATEDKAGAVIQGYRELVAKDAFAAILKLPEYIQKARNVNPAPHLEAMCGGPNQDWVGPILSSIGDVYSYFEVPERTQILRLCMNYLDGLRYDYSQNHVELIDDPWLVSDIMVTRPLYWPGFQQYTNMLERHRTWKEIKGKMSEVRSAFWMAMAVSWKDVPSEGVRRNFHRTFPTLMDRTADGIAAITAEHAASEAKKEGSDWEHNIQERLFKYDPKLVPKILKKIKERKWIKLDERY